MNNKHIEITKKRPYNSTYKRRHRLTGDQTVRGGVYEICDQL